MRHEMKIVHLATSAQGGAGRAATRLNAALVSLNLDSTIMYLGKRNQAVGMNEIVIARNSYKRWISSGVTYFQSKVMQNGSDPISSISLNSIDISSILKLEPDVIHIHNFYNLLSVENIIKLSEMTKVVMTLHDQRFFTAGCHYSHECMGYQLKCMDCPQVSPIFGPYISKKFQQNMNKLESKSMSLNLISPSKWLLNKANENSDFGHFRGAVIRNPIPSVVGVKERFYQDQSIHIGFCSDLLSNPLKGLSTLITATQTLKRDYVLHLIGNKSEQLKLPKNLKYQIHSPSDEGMLMKLISALDVLVVPSLEDNSPNVIGEALMCGTKVLGSNVGGISELMDELNLSSFNPHNPSELTSLLEDFEIKYSRHSVSELARKTFSFEVIATQVYEFYRDC